MNDFKTIKAAILKNRGGFANASGAQIMAIWSALDDDTKAVYLESVKETKGKKQDANSDG